MKAKIKKDRVITNLDIIQLYKKLRNLRNVPGFTLNRAIALTKKSLKPLYDAYRIDEMIPKHDAFIEYEKELKELEIRLATPDGATTPRTRVVYLPTGRVQMPDYDPNSEEAITARMELEAKYQPTLKIREKQLIEYNNWLYQECTDDYRILHVTEEDMPKEDGDYKALWDAVELMMH